MHPRIIKAPSPPLLPAGSLWNERGGCQEIRAAHCKGSPGWGQMDAPPGKHTARELPHRRDSGWDSLASGCQAAILEIDADPVVLEL